MDKQNDKTGLNNPAEKQKLIRLKFQQKDIAKKAYDGRYDSGRLVLKKKKLELAQTRLILSDNKDSGSGQKQYLYLIKISPLYNERLKHLKNCRLPNRLKI